MDELVVIRDGGDQDAAAGSGLKHLSDDTDGQETILNMCSHVFTSY